MPEKESDVPNEDQNFKAEIIPEQARGNSFAERFSSAEDWLKRRKQEDKARLLDMKYDFLMEEFSQKIDEIADEIIKEKDGLINECEDALHDVLGEAEKDALMRKMKAVSERIEPMIQDARMLIDNIRQFEKDELGMSGGSSRLENEVHSLEEIADIIKDWDNIFKDR